MAEERIREALRRIEELEREKNDLLDRVTTEAAISTRSLARYMEVEGDLSNLANLYVAGDQLHSTLDLSRVMTHMSELLEQLVGARAHAVYYFDEAGAALVAIGAHGVDRERIPRIPVPSSPRKADDPGPAHAIARAFVESSPVFDADVARCGLDRPVACIPLELDDRTVGVVVVYALLAQKTELTELDHELFRMLRAHASTAITGALLWAAAKGRLPSP
jgi:GAF domain-containing protein